MATRVIPLSPREHDVETLICKGLSDSEIAKTLGISEDTARHHVASIRKKRHAHTRLQIFVNQPQHLKLLRKIA